MSASLHPATVSSSNPDLAPQLSAILTGAAVAPITDRAFLRIAGPDATRWLNGMVTNNIQALQPGEGNYNFLLNAQGRILGDCTVYRVPTPEPAAYLLATDASQFDTIQQHLDKFIIMDDVELVPTPSNQSALLILGPKASSILQDYFHRGEDPSAMPPLSLSFNAEVPAQITTPSPSLVPQFEVGGADGLLAFAIGRGTIEVSHEALEALRILSGTPRYGVDIRNTPTAHELPQETAQTQALHFSKGCYLGQEIVERIRSRGNVHRTFHGFELTGELPPPGTQLAADSKSVGELTSVAAIPLPASDAAPARIIQVALGYIRREALELASARRLTLEYPGGTATPIRLPYAIP